jgi:hypothetical protein
MKFTRTFYLLPLCAAILFGQGPRGGGFGPGGPGGGFGGFGGRGADVLGAGPGSRATVTGAPYSATETVTRQQTLVGNQISRTQQSTVARDSSGRISTVETVTPAASTGKAAYTVQTIFDPVAGYRYELNSSTMIAFQSPLPKMHSGAPPTPPTPPAGTGNPNRVTTSLGTKTVNGESSTGTQITETIPAGAIGNAQAIQITRVTWVSTELKVPVEIQSSDPRFGSSDLELTNIVHTDPNPSLFLVPAGYTIKQGGRGGRGPGGPGGDARRGPGGNARRQQPQ